MKSLALGLGLVLLAAPADTGPKIEYFAHTREVTVTAADRQNYFVVDRNIWAHARHDLVDVRLYAGDAQVPYATTALQNAVASERRDARILNLGSVQGETEFDLDMEGIAEYDRVDLRLSAINFVATAEMEGRESLDAGTGVKLGTSTLYDFSRERLGSSFVLRMPTSTFRYLHVRMNEVKPEQVLGASVSSLHEAKAVWMAAGDCGAPQAEQRLTVFQCNLQPGMPTGRILFEVPAEQANFRRTVTVSDMKGNELCRSAISRVRMQQTKPPVDAEDLAINICYFAASEKSDKPEAISLRVVVDNGDDPALTYGKVEPEALEHRVYFDPQGKTSLRLYYGDALLSRPVYDYAKFFKMDAAAVEAQLGPETANPQFAGRPDDRPFSERHKALLWAAMLLAVAVLSVIAIRGMISSAKT